MGDHAYVYRGHSSYDDDDDDDKVCRTYIIDVDGRQRTVIGCSPYYDTSETYVVEKEVTERIRSPLVTDYRHGSPKKADIPARDYGSPYGSYEKYRSPSSAPYYDQHRRPQEVNDFLTGVQIEASRPNNNYHHTPPQNRPAVHSSTTPTPGYGGYGDYRAGNNYGGYSSDEDEREVAHYPRIEPPRPGPKVFSSIDEVTDYLKSSSRPDSVKPHRPNVKTNGTEAVKPFGANMKSSDAVKPYGYGSDMKSTESGKPYSNYRPESVKPYGYGSDKKSTESVKPYGTYGSESVKPYGYGSDRKSTESVKPYGTYGSESVKPYGYGSDLKSTESVKPYGSNLKSSEAVKPYSTYGSDVKSGESVKPYSTYESDFKSTTEAAKPYGTKHPINSSTGQPVIDCYEAARRYNGTVIRS
ncbi:hypothetical protein L484_000751 [Morus notabilis]|uniref:Uncharacterized protein n=1 Tax=Morus notabilis TaxID=981085 RepID=W9QP02_9ROSA|nr:hypothetical protein L484_000751 [Morus notabilis]